jgi:hypothetical protein
MEINISIKTDPLEPAAHLHMILAETVSGINQAERFGFPPNACVSDRRQRDTVSGADTNVEAASCSLDAMVRQ